jgi:hypothetical protein
MSSEQQRSGFWCDCGETLHFGKEGGAECNDQACIQWARCPNCDRVGGRYYEFEDGGTDIVIGCLNASGPEKPFASNQTEDTNTNS